MGGEPDYRNTLLEYLYYLRTSLAEKLSKAFVDEITALIDWAEKQQTVEPLSAYNCIFLAGILYSKWLLLKTGDPIGALVLRKHVDDVLSASSKY